MLFSSCTLDWCKLRFLHGSVLTLTLLLIVSAAISIWLFWLFSHVSWVWNLLAVIFPLWVSDCQLLTPLISRASPWSDWPGLNAIWVVSTALWSGEWSPHFGVPRLLFPNKEIAWESICDLQLLSQPSQCREQPESDSYISNICLLHSSFISLSKITVHRP